MNYSTNDASGTKAILYTRVSTDEQAEKGYSLRAQEERLRGYCALKNITVVEHFQDDASAKTFERSQFNLLLEYLKTHKRQVDYLLFVKWDRFSRNAEEAYRMIRILRDQGVEAQAVEQPIDLLIPENQLMLAFYLAAPQVENERRSLNVIGGMRRALREGRWCSGAPKGYTMGRDSRDKPLLIPNDDATIVHEAFEEIASGRYTQEEVRQKLGTKGFKCSKSQFNRMVRNVLYAGSIQIPAWRHEDEIRVKGLHEPIISEELFNQVQDIINGRKAIRRGKPSTRKEELPLRGFLRCAVCGGNLTGSASCGHGGRYFYYHCQKPCVQRVRADKANEDFGRYLKTLVPPKEIAELYTEIMGDVFREKEGSRIAELARIDSDINRVEEQLLNADEKFVEGQLESDSYRRLKESYARKLNGLKQSHTECAITDTNFMKYVKYGFTLAANLPEVYSEAPLEMKQKIIGVIFPEKLIYENGHYRTSRMNEVIALWSKQGRALQEMKKGLNKKNLAQSLRVVPTGFEPVQPP